MTEKEWLTGADGEVLAEYWGERFTERKARLLMLACCRRQERHVADASARAALNAVAAHFADPLAPVTPFDGDHFRELYRRIERDASDHLDDPGRGVTYGALAATEPLSVAGEQNDSFRYLAYSCMLDIARSLGASDEERAERSAQADLVREILGNPFRPVEIHPAWRTDTVLALARQMYAADEFSAMPILADALQDAGCDSEPVLSHCRPPRFHVRGCWVLDLLLNLQ